MSAAISPPVPLMICPHCWGSKHEPGSGNRCNLCGGSGVTPDAQLSEHFWLSEMLRSDTAIANGIPNDPQPWQVENLRRLCRDLLEPTREMAGPLHTDSGFRSLALNTVRGGSKSSAHLLGSAGDEKPLTPGVKIRDVIERVRDSKLKFDQIIYEGSWAHLALLGPNNVQRRQVLMAFPDRNGRMEYSPYDPNDSRVKLAA